jgi:cysteine desulfurase
MHAGAANTAFVSPLLERFAMTTRRIYLDYNASTPIDPAVAAAMRPFLDDHFGNPSSGHWASIGAKAALEVARGQVAALLSCHADEVVFTSGGSEANNLALKGAFFALREKGRRPMQSAH